jgi:hypothetical protein
MTVLRVETATSTRPSNSPTPDARPSDAGLDDTLCLHRSKMIKATPCTLARIDRLLIADGIVMMEVPGVQLAPHWIRRYIDG